MKRLMQGCLALFLMTSSALVATDEGIGSYASEVPGIGLIAETLDFGGITISNFGFSGHKYIFVKPNEVFYAEMEYTIDPEVFKNIQQHHLVIGLLDDGPQKDLLHPMEKLQPEGQMTVKLKAPNHSGVFRVRLSHTQGGSDRDAEHAWWRGDGPSGRSTVGIVIIK